MGLKIVISSAVELAEKDYVKEALEEIKKQLSVNFDWVYDCADHATYWHIKSKQDKIISKILSADWFVCLIPKQSVGLMTWEELKIVLQAVRSGSNIVVSVFHPHNPSDSEINAPIPERHISYDDIVKESQAILGNSYQQYCVDYETGIKYGLQSEFREEFCRLYYTDKVFRTQHLAGLAKLGAKVTPADVYSDEERAKQANGFIENSYCTRQSVDGKLEESLANNRKFIVLQGAPGSGKTRAMYQLLANPDNLSLASDKKYALGALANENIIVVTQDNVSQVYDFLVSEDAISCHNANIDNKGVPFTRYVLICDQLKDVFGMIIDKEKLYKFFELVGHLDHVRMIATTIPSAFTNFCERWSGYTRKPLENDNLTKVITIPQISDDDDEVEIRNWMSNAFGCAPDKETFGDHIPQLNDYKEKIVDKLYVYAKENDILADFLSAIQITEVFRRDTALFLPIMIVRANIIAKYDKFSYDIRKKLVDVVNFLIANNVIWVRYAPSNDNSESRIIKKLRYKDLELEYEIDDNEDFLFDGEEFCESPISTSYTYGVNEIILEHLLDVDPNKHIGRGDTLLHNYRVAKDVNRMATEFHRAFPNITNLRRILPRIPRNESYEESRIALWDFIYDKCKGMKDVVDADKFEFLTTIGILVGYAKEISDVRDAIAILEEKGIKPGYSILGELYSVGLRLGKECRDEIGKYIEEMCKKYELHYNSLFSMSRKIIFFDIPFDEAIENVKNAKYEIQGALLQLNDIPHTVSEDDLEWGNLVRLLATLSKRCENVEQWLQVLDLHRSLGIKLRRAAIRQFFYVVANCNTKIDLNTDETQDRIYQNLKKLLADYKAIVGEDNIEACFFSAVEASDCFRQTHAIYNLYVKTFDHDNPRLISRVLTAVRNKEFQKALNFLIEVNEKFKATGSELNSICFNNLIKVAPNMGEAVALVPHIPHLQEQTVVNILKLLKNKRKIKDSSKRTGQDTDPKIFYYAYSLIMREEFFEFRKSPYVIGILYDIARTAKQERFIRGKFLSHLSDKEKSRLIDLIDHSTTITSIRIGKNYRTLDEVWDIFNTCRNYYLKEQKYVNSEIYNSMMRKIGYLCKEEELNAQRKRLKEIIDKDSKRIIKDVYFHTSQYCFFPEKQIFGSDGNINSEFLRDISLSAVSKLKPLNSVLYMLLQGNEFEEVWKFYEYIVRNYEQSGKRKEVRPDIRTVTYLIEASTTKEQFEEAVKQSKVWYTDRQLRLNKIFSDAYNDKRSKFEPEQRTNRGDKVVPNDVSQQDYRQRTDDIICRAKKDIHYYGGLTSTMLNKYLSDVLTIKKNIEESKHLDFKTKDKCKKGTFFNIMENLINECKDQLMLDSLSYYYLIQLSPQDKVQQWMNEVRAKENIYKYDILICTTMAQNKMVCRADIDMAMDYFEFWEDIINDIGYDPSDPTSIDSSTLKDYKGESDYDGYWVTRELHCRHEMYYYDYRLKKYGKVDKVTLRFLKQQMELFAKYGVPFPCYYDKDFQKEIEAHKDLLKD